MGSWKLALFKDSSILQNRAYVIFSQCQYDSNKLPKFTCTLDTSTFTHLAKNNIEFMSEESISFRRKKFAPILTQDFI